MPALPCCLKSSLPRSMYMHLDRFTSILPAGWQARFPAGDATSLSCKSSSKEFCAMVNPLKGRYKGSAVLQNHSDREKQHLHLCHPHSFSQSSRQKNHAPSHVTFQIQNLRNKLGSVTFEHPVWPLSTEMGIQVRRLRVLPYNRSIKMKSSITKYLNILFTTH